MEQAQLFLRLLAMTEEEITSFLKLDDDVGESLQKLDLAARTRHIIHAVQLEDMWQQLNEESQTFEIHLAMKLSPMTLCSCLDFEVDMNSLEWRLVLPKYADIADDSKPTCVGDYLAMMKQIDIVDVNEYDIETTCAYLDQVYDFTLHKQNHQKPFTRSGR
jgi:hypothetical protein